MEWPADLFPACLLALAFLALIVVVEFWSRKLQPPPERTRKAVHMVGGAICLSFPYLLESPWTVAVLGLSLFGLIGIGRRYEFLHSLHGVERKSKGAEYYPLMIFALFWLARDTPWLYASSLLALAVADALAALVGGRYGRIRYQVDDESKTVEGSLTFFIVAAIVISIPLLLSGDSSLPSHSHRIAVACVAAVLITVLEAISRHGRDNIWIPLGTFLVLFKLIDEPISEVYIQLGSFAIVCLVLSMLVAASKVMNVGATLTLILAVYSSWALASFDWALPLICGSILCLLTAYCYPPEWPLRARAVMNMIMPVILAAGAADFSELKNVKDLYPTFFAAFVGGCLLIATQNVWSGVSDGRNRRLLRKTARVLLVASLVTAFITLPLWFKKIGFTWEWMALFSTITILGCVVHGFIFKGVSPSNQQRNYVLRRYLAISTVMLLCGAGHYFRLLPLLSPH